MPLSPQALRRRAKKFLVRNQLQLFVPVLPGLERLTAEQAKSIGQEIRIVHGGIEFRGRPCLNLSGQSRSADGKPRAPPSGSVPITKLPHAEQSPRRIDWPAVLGNCPDVSLHVSAASLASITRKPFVRQFLTQFAVPWRSRHHTVLVDGGPLAVKARFYQDSCTLRLDTTGEHLHRRDIEVTQRLRRSANNGTGMLLLAQSKSYDVIIDPFCGSGTFAIEAELIARDYPPGMPRRFTIESSPLHAPGILSPHSAGSCCTSVNDHSTQTVLGFETSPTAVRSDQIQMPTRPPGQGSPTYVRRFRTGLSASLPYPKGPKAGSRPNLPYGARLGTRTKTEFLRPSLTAQFVARSCSGIGLAARSARSRSRPRPVSR